MTAWRTVHIRYGRDSLAVRVPSESEVFEPSFPTPDRPPEELVTAALRQPVAGSSLGLSAAERAPGRVVIVVSDVTRPIPYQRMLPALLSELRMAGVPDDEVLILIATGLHRATTASEKEQMFGRAVLGSYRIVDHDAQDPASLRDVGISRIDGSRVHLDRQYVEAGFRIVTGLVEPHFMAGFSGGDKSICPGLCDLDSVRRFHGAELLADPHATAGNIHRNPVFGEATSVASAVPPHFSVQVVLNAARDVVAVFAGEPRRAHEKARALVLRYSCTPVHEELDAILTSCGGYPLDATFYQCVKGIVSCLPAVRRNGTVISAGRCSEGIGSEAYRRLMKEYGGDWRRFLSDIRMHGLFAKDQWQFQMHCRALEKLGAEGIRFYTEGLGKRLPPWLCVSGHSVPNDALRQALQTAVTDLAGRGQRIGVFPEGPYCVPVAPMPSAALEPDPRLGHFLGDVRPRRWSALPEVE